MNKVAKGKKLQGNPENLVFLVVDDDGQVRDILVGYLKSFGFKKILDAKDGKTALKVVQNHQQKIDFIISDWEMPHIDGLTLLRAVRKDPFREDVKFLMVSSQSSRERLKISEAAKAYVDAYVIKPFRASVLREKITNLIEHGVDPSSKDFESELQAVPHNDETFADPDGLGKVTVVDEAEKSMGKVDGNKSAKDGLGDDDESQLIVRPDGAGEASSLIVKPDDPEDKSRLTAETEDVEDKSGVTVNPDASDDGLVEVKPDVSGEIELGHVTVEDHKAPPENYNLHQMNLDLIVKLAGSYQKVKWFDKSIKLCTEALVLFPDSADLFTKLAHAQFLKGDWEAASENLKKAVQIKPYHVEAQTLIAEIAQKKVA